MDAATDAEIARILVSLLLPYLQLFNNQINRQFLILACCWAVFREGAWTVYGFEFEFCAEDWWFGGPGLYFARCNMYVMFSFLPFRLRSKAVYTDMSMDFWMTITTQTMIQTMERNVKRSRESQNRELSKNM